MKETVKKIKNKMKTEKTMISLKPKISIKKIHKQNNRMEKIK